MTVVAVRRPPEDRVVCGEIPSMHEAFSTAIRLAIALLPAGALLLHSVDGSVDAWIPTYLAEYGRLPVSDSEWTAVVDPAQDEQDRGQSYIGTMRI